MRTVLFSFVLLSATAAHATFEGTFWDPSFAGEGWAIESQNDLAFWTWYTYDANGNPVFRTALCDLSYNYSQIDSSRTTCTGDLYSTRNRTQTSRLGSFFAEFVISSGVLSITVNAAGNQRSLRPFDFNYSSPLDRIHGVWSYAELDTFGSSTLVVFESGTDALDDGTPIRYFETAQGDLGLIFWDDGLASYIALVATGTNRFDLITFAASDDKALGVTAVVDSNLNQLTQPSLVLATSITNTEGETNALRTLLGVGKSQTVREPGIFKRPSPELILSLREQVGL